MSTPGIRWLDLALLEEELTLLKMMVGELARLLGVYSSLKSGMLSRRQLLYVRVESPLDFIHATAPRNSKVGVKA